MNASGLLGRAGAQQPVASAGIASSSLRGLPVVQAAFRPQRKAASRQMSTVTCAIVEPLQRPDSTGRFGRFGGKYVPETLITALAELEQAYAEAMNDPEFVVRPGRSCLADLHVHLVEWPPLSGAPPAAAGRIESPAEGLRGPTLPPVPRRATVRLLQEVSSLLRVQPSPPTKPCHRPILASPASFVDPPLKAS